MKTETAPKIAEIQDGQWFVIQAPRFMGLLSGAYMAGFDREGGITLRYEDDTKEKAVFPLDEAQRLADGALAETALAGWMEIVGAVQREARK